jgi:hypothetical protein
MAVSKRPLHTHNRESLSDFVVSAYQMAWVRYERTIDKKAVEKWLSVCPQTYGTSNRENKDGEIDDQETRKGHGHQLR